MSRATSDWTAEDERGLERELARDERYRFLWLAGAGAILYPIGGILDWLIYPDQLRFFLTLRAVGTLVMLVAGAVAFLTRSYPVVIACESVSTVAIAWNLSAIAHATGQASPIFAGLMLIQVFAAVLTTMPLWLMALVNALILAGYLVPLLRYPVLDVHAMAGNLFLLSGGAIASSLGTGLRGRLARREFLSRRANERANAELRSLQGAKDQMFQNVSHEFRTPLTLILAPVERWLANPRQMANEAEMGLASIRRSALRLLNLINDLLDLARLDSAEAAQEPLPAAPEDVRELLGRIADDVRPLAQQQGVGFESQIPEGPLVYRVPGRSLEKIVLNLLSNALKFTSAGGSVGLLAKVSAEGALTISVRDSGIGIPPEAHARVFERFRQVDGGTARRYGGTGIGLALVAELARRLNAELTLQSAPGKGSTFSVTLPPTARAAAMPVAREPLEHSVGLARRAAFAALAHDIAHTGVLEAGDHGPRLLLAEDDPQLNAELVRMLAPTYRVRSVSDGSLAFQEAQREPPDLLLSDVMMPGMDGVTLAKSLRQHPALRETAIVLLSARAALEDRVSGREVGVDTYLTKPFNPRELLATLEGLLRARMRVVGKYLLGPRLGEGAQCEVYRAEHVETGQVVALKMLTSRIDPGQEGESWLTREREALGRLSHPNIVRILEQGRQEQRFYMVMEQLKGKNLGAICSQGTRLDAASVVAIGHALADALTAVHDIGLVHRDVKVENVLIVEEGPTLRSRVRLIDFGVVFDTTRSASGEAATAGTLSYMAPELATGAHASFASDQYATGVCLYLMLTGQHPFRRASRSATTAAILAATPAPISETVPDVPPFLADIIARALRADPVERWPNMAAMAQALETVAGQTGTPSESLLTATTEIGKGTLAS
jgi:signal transduction histidine kinase/DNA-binding response OmpR family regulator